MGLPNTPMAISAQIIRKIMRTKTIDTILRVLFLTFSSIKCILSPINPNRSPMTTKSNNDQLTWLEKNFPNSGINNSNRGYNTLLTTVIFMIK